MPLPHPVAIGDPGHVTDHNAIHQQLNDLAAGGGSGASSMTVLKAVNETVNNSTAWNPDDALTVPIAANEALIVSFVFFYSSDAAADFRVRATVPVGAAGKQAISGLAGGVTAAEGTIKRDEVGLGATIFIGGAGVGDVVMGHLECVVRNGATAGNVTLEWGQAAAAVSDTVVYADSYARVHAV